MRLRSVLAVLAPLVLVSALGTRLVLAQEHGGHQGKAETAEGAEHGAEHHAAGGHAHGPPDINLFDFSDKERPAYIAMLLNFGILAALYYTLGKKPVTEGLKQRRITIGKEIEEAR